MTPDKNFRMTKRTKTLLAILKMTGTQRSDFKSSMIDAEASAEAARKQSLKAKGNKAKDGE